MESVTKTNLVEININDLNKDPNHPRQDLGDLEGLLSSLRKDGQQVPINVNLTQDGICFYNDGWRRIEALKKMGKETVLCLVHDGYIAADAAHQSYIINTQRSQLNPIEIALHIKRMVSLGFTYRDLEIKGYGSTAQISTKVALVDLPEDIQAMISKGELSMAHGAALLDLEKDDERSRMAKRAVDHEWSARLTEQAVRRYKDQCNRKPSPKVSIPDTEIPGVYFKDSKDMSEQEDKSVGLIFTSPNYFIGKEFEQGYSFEDHLDNIEAVMKECARIIVPGGVIALNLNDILNFKGKKGDNKKAHVELMAHRYQSILKKHAVLLESQIIWVKGIDAYSSSDRSRAFAADTKHAEYRIINRHEYILVFRKNGERKAPSEEAALASVLTKEEWSKYIPSVWQIPQVWKSEGHPTVFPDELARRIIKMYSFVGEIVLDPFLGSGTTVKVARELSREGIGYEREEKYKDTIMKKLGVAEPAEKEKTISTFIERTKTQIDVNQPKLEIIYSKGIQGEEVEQIKCSNGVIDSEIIASEGMQEEALTSFV